MPIQFRFSIVSDFVERITSRSSRLPRRRRLPVLGRSLATETLEPRLQLAVNVLAFEGGITSGGANTNETQLTPANVAVNSFGKLFATSLDGQMYAQPLIDTGVTIAAGPNTTAGAAGVHNVVYMATEHDSLYAIDASSSGGQILWHRSFLDASNPNNNTLGATNITTVTSADVASNDISPEIGITGTPVIDPATGTLYVVVTTKEVIGGVTNFVQRLHAINISDGTDRVTPYLIGDTTGTNTNHTSIYVYGTGDGAVTDPYNGTGKQVVQFNALTQNQRAAMSFVNNTVYVAWASHGDNGPYHGWVVAWDVSNLGTAGLVVKGVFNTSPNDGLAGIWGGGGAMAFEPDGSAFYFETGNGSGGAPTVGANGLPTDANYNEALVKVQADPTTSPTNQNPNGWGLKAVSFFIPYNVAALDGADSDFGSGSPILLPPTAGIPGHPNLIVAGGKEGKLYVLDRNNLGGFNATNDNALNSVPNGSGNNTPPVLVGGLANTPAWYNGHLYVISAYGSLGYIFTISSTGTLVTTSISPPGGYGGLPGSPIISANGTTNGILWAMDLNTNELHAYAATTFSTELWNSNMKVGGGDALGAGVKFATPVEANGMVYVGTATGLVVYGLAQAPTAVPVAPVISAVPTSGTTVQISWTDATLPPNTATGYSIQESTNGVNFSTIATAASGSTSITISGLQQSTSFYFQLIGFNSLGNSAPSNIVNVVTTGQALALDFSSGFAGSTSMLTYNGNAAIVGTQTELTNGNPWQVGSIFSTSPVTVSQFTAQFTMQISAGTNTADGMTFCIQGVGPTALGGAGSNLGFGGIANSVAIKFDLYNNAGEGVDSTGLFIDGAAPTNTGSIDLTSSGINLHSGDPLAVTVNYSGTTLTVLIVDNVTGASATETYTVNIPATVGSSTAYVGFTGGSGTTGATQSLLTWTYSTTIAAVSPNSPSALGASPATATSVNLTWTNNATNQTGFYLDRATDPAFSQNVITQTLPASPNAFTDSAAGLAPGSTFYYRLRAFNAAGPSANSNVALVSIPLAPPTPTNQSITGVSTSEIDMSWQDNAGHLATSYVILRAVNQGMFTTVATLPPTSRTAPSQYSWSDTTVTPGNYYEYHIEAINSSGHNDFAGVNATSITTPPTSVAALPGPLSVSLSWVAPVGAQSFNVYRGTSPGGEGATPLVTGLTSPSYIDTAVTPGVTYYYTVTAVNPNIAYSPPLPAESAASIEVSAIPALLGPSGLTATPGVGNSIFVTWTNNTSNQAGFHLDRATNATFTQNLITQTLPANPNSFTDTAAGLTPGVIYYYRLRAFNAGAGDSANSNTANATIPGQVVALNFSSGFAGSTSQLTYNNFAAISGSQAVLTNGNPWVSGSVFTTTAVSVTQFTTQFTMQIGAGAATGDGMTFCIQGVGPTALGGAGSNLGFGGIASSVAIKFDLYNNSGEGNDSTGLFINGAAPTNPGSVDLTSTGINLHSGDPLSVSMSYSGTTLTVTMLDTTTGASATQSYPINIAATVGGSTAYVGFTGATGGSTATQSILNWTFSNNTGTVVTPTAPSLLGAVPASATSIALSWTNSATNQTGFYLDRATDPAFTQNLFTQTLPASPNTFTDTSAGLTAGVTYYYRLRAFNANGSSAESNVAPVTIVLTPAAPTNPAITAVGTAQISMSWQDNAGANASGYTIMRSVGQGAFATWVTLPASTQPAPSTYTWSDINLTPGTNYQYEIIAYNASGNSNFAALNATTITAAPTSVAAVPGVQSVSLSWVAPTGAQSFNVYRGTSPGGEGATPLVTGLTSLSYIDTAVTPGATYYYTVTAVNANIGYTPPLPAQSAASIEVSAIPTLPAPTNLAGTQAAGNSVSLTWANSATNQTGFHLDRATNATFTQNLVTQTLPASPNSFTDAAAGLTPGVTYYYRLRAFNAGAGDSANSNTATVTIPPAFLNFSSGFAGSTSQLTYNNFAAISGSQAVLTNGNPWVSGSVFTTTAVSVTQFTTQFTMQIGAGAATGDGMTFCIQGVGPTALGGAGSNLGFGGIASSVAIKFDLYNNSGEGNDSTGLFINGAAPTNPGSVDLTSTGINLHSGDPLSVSMSYSGTTLTVTMLDTTTGASATQSYPINIAATVGGSTAYVGFTGATGGSTATQSILNWTFSQAPPAPTNPVVTAVGTTQISLSWQDNAGAQASGYTIMRAVGQGAFTSWATLPPNLQSAPRTYTWADTNLTPGSYYQYQIIAYNGSGSSGFAAIAATTLTSAPTNLSVVAASQTVDDQGQSPPPELDLSWSAPTGAQSFNVYRGTSPGGEGATPLVTGLTTASYADLAITPGVTYYYTVTAVNANFNYTPPVPAESAPSGEVAGIVTIAPAAPVVQTNPVSQTIVAGNSVTFSAAATGSPFPTVQWQVSTNGGATFTNIAGATAASYTFTTTTAQNGNAYQAVFTNSQGTATTTGATLTVTSPLAAPTVTTNPASQTIVAGSSVTFTAAASGNPAPTVQWQVSTNGGTTFTNIAGATSASYTFATAAAQTGNEYQAVFTNSQGAATTTAATLTVSFTLAAPAVTTNPVSQTILSGSSVTFTAAASGNPAPTVQWQVSTNGGTTFTNIAGATSATYSFSTTAAQNGTEYQAVFTNSQGTATTTAATLTVTFAPTVTTYPASQTIVAGNSVTFTAAASGNPAPTVQWQVSTNGGTTFTNIAGATSATYSFSTTAAQNGYEYQAMFTNAAGTATTTATLTVNAPPAVTTNPLSQTIVAGSSVTFTAAASGNPAPTVQWQLSTNGGATFTNIAGAISATYSFSTTAAQNGSEYQAVFTNSQGTATTTAATLTVNAAPAVTTNPVSQTIVAGSSVTFTAAASGNPTPTVQWQLSTNGGTTFTNIAGATSTSYSFTTTAAQNGYEYQAVFTNAAGTATTTTATLTVNAPPAVTTNPASQTIAAGSSVTFTAAASGNPAPTVQWQLSTNGGTTFTNIAGATSSTYSFSTTAGQNGSEYQAVFTNSVGTATTSAATLTVNAPPTVTTNPVSQTIVAGSSVTFTAAASGNPGPTVQWQLSTNGGTAFTNISGATSPTYSFTTTAAQSGYEYQAVFTNSVGTATTTAATLTVNAAPSVTTNPLSQTITAGNSVTFTAAASGTPTPTVQWQVSTNSGSTFTNISGATATTYSFSTTAGETGYQYRAVFTNAAGTATTTAATLTVNAAPSVTTSPLSQSITAGSSVTFTAAASGTPAPTVQWQVSTNSGSTFTNVSGATSTTYTFSTTAGETSYQYRAVFTNSVGTATTTAATLTVNVTPSVTTNPLSQTITAGNSVTFSAAASGTPTPTVQWQVSTNSGSTFTNISGATATTYTFSTTATQNGYQYRAVFANAAATATTSAATLTVTSAPVVTTNPTSQTIAAGSSVTFTAAASGSPTPTVQWQVSTNGGTTFTNITGATSTSYTFTAIASQSTYQYRAVFTNSLGSATTSAATLAVTTTTLTVNPTSLPNWTVNAAGYNQTITTTGGIGAVTYASGQGLLPAGLSLNASTGAITGKPTATGTYSFTIAGFDAVGDKGSRTYTITINAAIAMTPTTLPGYSVNQAGYSQTIKNTGGTGAITFAITLGALPTGLTLNASTGLISGTPSAAATYNFTITATDSVGATAATAYSVTINKASTTVALTSNTATPTVGQTVTFTATISVVAPAAGTPTGTVTFMDGTTVLGTGTLKVVSGIVTATFSTSTLAQGTHSITAVYAGDGNDTGSTSAVLKETVS